MAAQPRGTGEARAPLLYNRRLLSVPKLLDVCALYGRDNPALTGQLLQQASVRNTLGLWVPTSEGEPRCAMVHLHASHVCCGGRSC